MSDTPKIATNPDGSKTIRLDEPLIGHKGMVSEIKLRAPRYRDFMRLGDPTVLVYGKNSLIPQEDIETIAEYVKALVVDVDPLLLEQASLADAMALRDAVKGFFRLAGTPST